MIGGRWLSGSFLQKKQAKARIRKMWLWTCRRERCWDREESWGSMRIRFHRINGCEELSVISSFESDRTYRGGGRRWIEVNMPRQRKTFFGKAPPKKVVKGACWNQENWGNLVLKNVLTIEWFLVRRERETWIKKTSSQILSPHTESLILFFPTLSIGNAQNLFQALLLEVCLCTTQRKRWCVQLSVSLFKQEIILFTKGGFW